MRPSAGALRKIASVKHDLIKGKRPYLGSIEQAKDAIFPSELPRP